MSASSFPCASCGACCRRMKPVIDAGIPFPFKVDETGKCEKLGLDNKCTVYENRPDICNIDKMIEIHGIDKDKAYIDTINVCNTWMEEDGLKTFIKI